MSARIVYNRRARAWPSGCIGPVRARRNLAYKCANSGIQRQTYIKRESQWFDVFLIVYKIPYRHAPRSAFRPSASREQRYLAYNIFER